MADRWMDEREELDRQGRERGPHRYRRYASDDRYERGYDRDERSFQPRDYDRGRTFGERETGMDYTGSRYGGRNYSYDTDPRGGRFYGDTGRERLYREEYAPYSITRGGAQPMSRYAGGYDPDRYGDRWRDDERAYRVAYGEHHGDHRGHYEDERRGFWERASDRVASWFGEDDRGQHRGRGPSGYKRTDERISEDVHERLTEDPWLDASAISVAVSNGEVTLSGAVPERESKHRAERLIEDMSGISHVQNNLRVRRPDPITGSGVGFGDSANAERIATEGAPPARGRTN
ncbi:MULTISPECIES: BON domain-containing protein [Phenylobacterium]|uniref:Osmotically-inducible protein OsmY n=1 Tax=Phenylobacterium koreense TaxID=266125 RepID=A0ABV2EL88_9CAUL